MWQQVGQLVDVSGVDELVDTTSVTPWDLLWAALLLIGGLVVARLTRRWLDRVLSRTTQLPEGIVNMLVKITGWTVVAIAVVFALPLVGVDVTPIFILMLLIAAILVLSGRVLLENYGAGVILQAEAMFQPGDQIETNDFSGDVVEVSSRTVLIEARDGRRIVVPNTSVLREPLVILTAQPERRSEITVGLAYGTDLDGARQVLTDAVQQAPGVVAQPPVEALVTEFGDNSINFLVRFWHASDILSGYVVMDEVARAVNRACVDHGLTIAFPQRTLWWGEPPAPDAAPEV